METRNISLGNYIPLILISALISWTAFSLVVLKLSPPMDGASKIGIIFFYLSLFFALTSSFTLIVYFVRTFTLGVKNSTGFNIAIRQGGLLSFLAIVALMLQSIKILNWWSGILLVAAILLIEFYFSSIDDKV